MVFKTTTVTYLANMMQASTDETWHKANGFCKGHQFGLLQVLSHNTWKLMDDATNGFLRQYNAIPIGLTCVRTVSKV